MADNKKKKVDFREALQAQADKVVPKDKSKETVTVDIGGVPTEVARGGMDDATWERVKAAASPADTTMKSKALDWPKLMSMGQDMNRVADSVVSKEEKALVQKMPEWDRAEFLRQRFKSHGYDVPLNTAEDERKSLRPPTADVAPPKRDQGSPDEWAPMPSTKPTGGQTEDDQYPGISKGGNAGTGKGVKTAGNTFSPLSQAMQMATGATGAAPDEQVLAEVNARGDQHGKEDLQALKNAASAVGGVSADVAKAAALASPTGQVAQEVDQRVFGDKPLIPDAVSQLPQAIGAGAATDLGTIGQVAGQALGMPNLARAGADLSNRAVMPPAYGGPAEVAPTGQPPTGTPTHPAPGPTPEEAQAQKDAEKQNQALQLAMSAPGGFQEAGVDPALRKHLNDAISEGAKNAQTQRETIQQTADNLAWQQWEATKLQRQKMADAESLAAEAAQAQVTHAQEAEKFNNARQSVLEEARRAAANPIDPNRFWNNKDAGQKASAIIAGALFGFTGQGMQWLQRLDGLVAEDNRLQAADRASKVEGLRAEAEGLGLSAKMALERGATLAQAKIIERDAKYQSARGYLEQLVAQTQNAQIQMQAMNMMGQIDQRQSELAAQGLQLGVAEAGMKNSARAANAHLAQGKFGLMAKTLAAGGKEAGVKGPQAMELGGLAAATKVAEDLRAKFGDKNIVSRLFDKGAALFPGTDASDYNNAARLAIQMIGPMMGSGVLQKHDLDRWESLIAQAGDLNGKQKLDILVSDIKRTYEEKKKALGSAGMNVSQFQDLGSDDTGVDFTAGE